ncbi:hypothetical protein LHFGNBLO_000716 [Mesorhizobium sp. AR10]|uniref:hypothetical protein n=1 Tax=Mesorhizobium sp. AR10 TaxID=2865839 RepID=UPI002160FA3C|nr:hypothetical protein [Mesorhizobium sp. AR10]UVK39361.1 hypothetical protein LHFGNBLO_000716 [Mesorhizobium sp. AR10]
MATKARKPVKGKTAQPKATQAKAGAGPAIAARSKDAKPAFGKAAPKKVVPGTTAKVAAKTAKPKKPASGGGSMAGNAMRTVKATANVAAGAVVATARGAASLAASVIGKGGSKAKAKAK